MKLLAINGSPRRAWNTAQLLEHVVEGARSVGAEAELVHLRDIEPYKGCISCFHCKDPKGKYYGRCAVKDNLTPLLDKAHEADVLVLGSPFYFSMETGLMRNCMERLWFQYFLYTTKKPPLSPRKNGTALVYTMNIKEEDFPRFPAKEEVIATSKGVMERLFGSCEVFLCTDTKQFKEYSRYEVDYFDVPAKLERHETVFPQDLERAFAMGKRLVG